ncbi:MAG: aldehyde dehydrogenase family protein, partial [Sediminibacterium sp.]|nr:aldehyde dehydrogenase family protein [Sediminibacterium sp.]
MNTLADQLQLMRQFFQSGATQSYAFRKQQLIILKNEVTKHEEAIYEALYADLHKSKEECWVTENGFFLTELKDALANL